MATRQNLGKVTKVKYLDESGLRTLIELIKEEMGKSVEIRKYETPVAGYYASYGLFTKDKEEPVIGVPINIPYDYELRKSTVKKCEVDDDPVVGYKVGDLYIDSCIAPKTVPESTVENYQHVYIRIKDFLQAIPNAEIDEVWNAIEP